MKEKLLFGTALLTISGLICRLIGFFYRIFLSYTIGAEGLGIYQLIVPLYYLSYAISTAGIQTALSRLIASATAKKDHKKATAIFLMGTGLSFLLSFAITLLIRSHSAFLSEQLLGDVRCTSLLQIMAYALPFASIHSCVIGWFMGKKQIHLSAVTQILEELIRFAASWSCYLYFIKHHVDTAASIPIIGLLFSEFFSVLLSILILCFHKEEKEDSKQPISFKCCLKEMLTCSTPITLNRVSLNLLHSIEAILIPLSLEKHDLSRTEALETLGIVSGMALPLVLFPTAVVNALSSILLPLISEYQALHKTKELQKLIKKSIDSALLLGTLCTFFFLLTGTHLGMLLYSNSEVGHYITLLSPICPLLFCDIILASILNGLGRTFFCFFVNLSNMVLRLCLIYFFVPVIGIYGYLIGLILGELLCSIVSILLIFHLFFKKQSIDK